MGDIFNSGVQKKKGCGTEKRNNLTLHQHVRLLDLIRSRIEGYQRQRTPFADVAKELEKEVGYPLTEANIRTVLKAANLLWVPRPRRTTGVTGKLRNRVRVLERVVQELCTQLNVALPVEWDTETVEAKDS